MSDLLHAPRDAAERSRTLEIVARWLVRDLIERAGQTSPGELTDAAFAVLHPELGGRAIARGEAALIADYQRIRRDLVDPALAPGRAAAASAPPVAGGLVPLGGPKVPPGYRVHRSERGLARYSAERLDAKLRALRAAGRLAVTDDEIDTFQRIANVETGGTTQALNTWDSGVVSIGFFQLTLQHGKLQRLIASAPGAFARYGIELDPPRRYPFKQPQLAIKGAATTAELRWNGWADRFYRAGLDDEILVAQVIDGRAILERGLASARRYLTEIPGGYELFSRAYAASLPLRGLYQEALNNKPVGAREGLRLAARRALAESAAAPARLYAITREAMRDAFRALGDASSGESIATKTASA
jgi:hypothetical protein